MKYLISIIASLFICNFSFPQNRLVMSGNIYMTLGDYTYMVIDNSSSNAITNLGTGGNIISEGEYRRVKWNIGTQTGTYTVPFTKSAGNKIPVSLNITGAGIGNGSVLFSTYGGNIWDNNTYKPSDVTHMNSLNTFFNNSAYVIDRFWLIDAVNYTVKPTISLLFTYLDAEWSATGNSVSEANLLVQRFNSNLNKWADWIGNPQTANTSVNTVESGSISSANFFRSWTLVDQGSVLSVSLLSCNAICHEERNKILINWTTASESNNDYFVVEKSSDNLIWDSVSIVDGSGNSNKKIYYSYMDDIYDFSYYRLKQVDFDGKANYSDIIYADCPEHSIELINIYPNPASDYFYYSVSSDESRKIIISVIDVLGREVIRKYEYIDEGINEQSLDISNLISGIYFFNVEISDIMSNVSKQFIVK